MKILLPVVALAALALCGCPNSNPTTCTYDSDCGGDSMRCCGSVCKDITKDVGNCGACGAVCPAVHGTATCEARVCKIACDANRGNCDNDLSNGCEADLGNDAKNCGVCGTACFAKNAKGVCGAGTCGQGSCDMGFADCNANTGDGCETNTQEDLMNCGACGKSCTVANGTPKCFGGTCAVDSCKTNFANCDNDAATGCETNIKSDAMHCGSCDVQCAMGEACVAGMCRKAGLILFGGSADPTSGGGGTADVTRFDPTTKAFEKLSPVGTEQPEGRAGHLAVWDSDTTRMIVYGGQTASADTAVWALDFSVDPPAWSKLPASASSPGARAGMCWGYDRANRTVYAFGGQDDQGTDHNDLWKLNVADGTWAQLQGDSSGSTAPPANVAPSCSFIASSGTLVLFGGLDSSSAAPSNTVWTYATKALNPAWAIAKVGNPPDGRFFATFVQDTEPLVLFGGAALDLMTFATQNYNDVQLLDLGAATPTWTQESANGASGVPEPRAACAAAALAGTRYLFGGAQIDLLNGSTPYDDVWAYDEGTKMWTQLSPNGATGAPDGKAGATLVIPQ